MKCPNCSGEIKEDDAFCGYCGKPVGKPQAPAAAPQQPPRPAQPAPAKTAEPPQRPPPHKRKKRHTGWVILLIVLAFIAGAVLGVLAGQGKILSGILPFARSADAEIAETRDREGEQETEPTAAPEPTETPAPIETPAPTETPAPAATPEPTIGPAPSEEPYAPEELHLVPFTGPLTEYTPVYFSAASASSEIEDHGTVYYATNVIDGDLTTSWQEDAEDDGIGEYLIVYFEQRQTIDVLGFRLGYAPFYENNNRPKKLLIEFSDGSAVIQEFRDVNETVYLELDRPVTASSIKLTILDVYSGEMWDDTCITEVMAFRSGRR